MRKHYINCSIRIRRGFTLVELLVVVGIIALLISILMPALTAARAQANLLKCESQLRTLGQALLMHANDHKQYMPLAGKQLCGHAAGASWVQTPATPANLGDQTMQKYDYYIGTTGTPFPMPMAAALAQYLGTTCRSDSAADVAADISQGALLAAFTCPSDERIALLDQTTCYGPLISDQNSANVINGYTSYVSNIEMFGTCAIKNTSKSPLLVGHSRAAGFIPKMGDLSSNMLLMDGIINFPPGPGGMWIFGDNTPETLYDAFTGNAAGAGSLMTPSPAAGSDAFQAQAFPMFRHKGRVNILFGDGHVSTVYILANGGYTASNSNGYYPGSGDLATVGVTVGMTP